MIIKLLVIGFLISIFVNGLLLLYADRINSLASDHIDGSQKFHTKPTLRIGGFGVYIGFIALVIYFYLFKSDNINIYF